MVGTDGLNVAAIDTFSHWFGGSCTATVSPSWLGCSTIVCTATSTDAHGKWGGGSPSDGPQSQRNLKQIFLRRLVFPMLFGASDGPPHGGVRDCKGGGGDDKGGGGYENCGKSWQLEVLAAKAPGGGRISWWTDPHKVILRSCTRHPPKCRFWFRRQGAETASNVECLACTTHIPVLPCLFGPLRMERDMFEKGSRAGLCL